MLITIPFTSDMALAIIEGKKSCTTRTKQYGSVSDVFRVEHDSRFETLIITQVERYPLSLIANHYYKAEGFSSPDEFKEKWRQLHPRRGYRPDDWGWTHFFEKE